MLERRREERSEVTASSVFAACMTDTDWSFSLRSATGLFGDADSDDNEDHVGDAGNSSHLSSSNSQMLQQIDLAAREDSAQYKPNPWSIARVNAASRPQQPNATVKPVSEKPAVKKIPQGAIVDAFKRQAQKPKATTNSSAQVNRLQTPSQEPALDSAIDALDDSVSPPARSPTSIAHITTPAVDPVPIPSQLRIPQEQHQEAPLLSFLPEKTFPPSRSSQSTNRSSNLQFTPNIKRVQPFSSPAHSPSHPQYCIPSIYRPHAAPPQAPAYFEPHIIDTHTPTPSKAHIVTSYVSPSAPVHREDGGIVRPSHSNHHPTPVKPERKTISPHPRQGTQLPRPRFNQPIIKASPKSGIIPHSPSFAQARRFFEYDPPPVTVIKQPSPETEPPPKDEPTPSLPPSRPVIASPPRKYIDPYDQFPPSPDSEWSTLKPSTRKGAAPNGKGKSKASDIKSGKFKLPLSMGSFTPKKPPQKKPRVITYLPPPPPKKQKTVAEPPLATRNVETCISTDRILWSLLSLAFVTSLSLQRFKIQGLGRAGYPLHRPRTKRLHQAHLRLPCNSIRTVCSPAIDSSARRSDRYV